MKAIVTTCLLGGALWMATLSAGPVSSVEAAGDAAGKKVFLEYKCTKCHTVKSAKIESTAKKGKSAHDLSGVGDRHSREWLGKYLRKEESLHGKKHKAKFRGESAEEKALLDFLAGLKGGKK